MKQLLVLTAIVVVAVMSGCRKKEVITKYDNPNWQFTDTLSYTYISATAVIALPDNLQPYIDDNDQMAVFVGDVCRGVANLEDGLFNFSIPTANAEEIASVLPLLEQPHGLYVSISGTSSRQKRCPHRHYRPTETNHTNRSLSL